MGFTQDFGESNDDRGRSPTKADWQQADAEKDSGNKSDGQSRKQSTDWNDQEVSDCIDYILGEGRYSTDSVIDSHTSNAVRAGTPTYRTAPPDTPSFTSWGPSQVDDADRTKTGFLAWKTNRRDEPEPRSHQRSAWRPAPGEFRRNGECISSPLSDPGDTTSLETLKQDRERQRAAQEEERLSRRKEELKTKVSRQKTKLTQEKSSLDRLQAKIAIIQSKIEALDSAYSVTDNSDVRRDIGMKLADEKARLLTLKNEAIDIRSRINDNSYRLQQLINEYNLLT